MLRRPQEANANGEEIQLGERPQWGSAGTVAGQHGEGGRAVQGPWQGSTGRAAGQHAEGECAVCVAVLREGLRAGGGGSSTRGRKHRNSFRSTSQNAQEWTWAAGP